MTETKFKWRATGTDVTLNQVNNGCLAAGLSDAPTAAGITGILTTAFTKDGPKKEKIGERAVWKEKAMLTSGVRGQMGQTGGRPQKGSGMSNKRWLQPASTEAAVWRNVWIYDLWPLSF